MHLKAITLAVLLCVSSIQTSSTEGADAGGGQPDDTECLLLKDVMAQVKSPGRSKNKECSKMVGVKFASRDGVLRVIEIQMKVKASTTMAKLGELNGKTGAAIKIDGSVSCKLQKLVLSGEVFDKIDKDTCTGETDKSSGTVSSDGTPEGSTPEGKTATAGLAKSDLKKSNQVATKMLSPWMFVALLLTL